MRKAAALAALALVVPSITRSAALSAERWDLAPLDGLFDKTTDVLYHDAAVDSALDEIRQEVGRAPEMTYSIPRAPIIPNRYMPEPEVNDFASKLMWSLSAHAEGNDKLAPLPGVAKRIHDGRPADGFELVAMPEKQLGEFDHLSGAPKLKLSKRLEHLRSKGVPTEYLASVMAHELKHGKDFYAGALGNEASDELRAFQSEAEYARSIGKDKIHARLEEAAAAGDKELSLFYADLALIVEADEQGVLPYYIKRAYGLKN